MDLMFFYIIRIINVGDSYEVVDVLARLGMIHTITLSLECGLSLDGLFFFFPWGFMY